MLQRIRLAMQAGTFEKVAGQVEIDETFIGGKSRNMHKSIREQKISGTGGKDKAMVVGVLQRGGNVRATVTDSRKRNPLQAHVREHVEPGAEIFTDALKSYEGLDPEYAMSGSGGIIFRRGMAVLRMDRDGGRVKRTVEGHAG